MDFIKTKKITFSIFSIMVLALLFSLAKTIMNYPKINSIELGKINGVVETETQPQNYNDDVVDDATFEYELIGYRVDTMGANSSVVVKKNNEEYVVQVGDLLENKYKLLSVSEKQVIFDYSGRIFELENLVGK
jgi:type II secretory pathway component PulC